VTWKHEASGAASMPRITADPKALRRTLHRVEALLDE